ncbi:ATP-binding protein [Candidatus Parabeggiatoa sp. HSG14]|uniref:ATP-binding protein n=1 Tax=Candidatus Parabeggiatoa sp. HSG14 TaxID=3055593 RepID=UPI0025A74F63|nr:DUF4325 domain-containing protein [Thiotrichales bacterium HSG14]
MNKQIIKIPDGYSFQNYDVYNFEPALAVYNWEIVAEKVVIDMSHCFHANYQSLALLTLYIWYLNSQGIQIEFSFSHKNEGASKMWHLMGATSWYQVLTKSYQNFKGHDCKPLIAIKNQQDCNTALLKIESYTKGFHVEYEKILRYVISELLYNTLEHGFFCQKIGNEEKRISSIIQLKWSQNKQELRLIIADLGIGIKKHLEATYQPFENHYSAIRYAIQPQVSGTFGINEPYKTKDNAGVGLYIASNILQRLNADMHIISGDGWVHISPRQITNRTMNTTWRGTFVLVNLSLEKDFSLSLHALMSEFREAAIQQISRRKQADEQEKFYLSIENYFGRYAEDKEAALKYRDKKLIPAVNKGQPLLIDFDNVISAPHSFLSGLLATPIKLLGLKAYKKIKIVNAAPEIRETVDYILDENT